VTAVTALHIPAGEPGVEVLWDRLRHALAGQVCLGLLPTDPLPNTIAALHLDGPSHDLDGIAVVMPTSGSTGQPRGVLCSPSALIANTDGPDYQWVLALPASSMGGLKVVLRAMVNDIRPWGVAAPIERELPELAARPTPHALAISLVPTQLAMCLRDVRATQALATFAHVLIGGAHLPQPLAARAMDAGIAIAQSYGATETCGGCVVDGRPLPGVSVTIDVDGRIRLQGPMVASGYRCDANATSESFTHDSFLSQDIGVIDDDGILSVLGRKDDIVTITGINVSTDAVADCLLAHPDVDEAAVVVIRRSDHSPELAAYLVGNECDVVTWVRERLGAAAIPRNVHWLPGLPLLPNGKVDRGTLMREFDGNTE
jgi:O-succinylbenzoic acid--CoA ligase